MAIGCFLNAPHPLGVLATEFVGLEVFGDVIEEQQQPVHSGIGKLFENGQHHFQVFGIAESEMLAEIEVVDAQRAPMAP